jgi:hypothetical protein
MKHGSTIKFFLISSLALSTGANVYAEEQATPVKVEVYAKHHNSRIIYNYRVFNNTEDTIDSITIGRDSLNDDNPGNDVWELQELPSGWTSKLGIPAASSNSPTGWRVSLIAPETGDNHAIKWEISNSKTPTLSSGQSMAKMSVSLDQPDNNYLFGHAMLHFDKHLPDTLTVPLEQLDLEPPTLVAAASPAVLAPTGKLVPVSITFPVKTDYYDPLPEIKLESVTASEPVPPEDVADATLGIDDRYLKLRASTSGQTDRVYMVIYSATDGSGNQTLASVTVTVPYLPPVDISSEESLPANIAPN